MNILQLSRVFVPSTGGIEKVTYGLTKALVARGHRAAVLTLRTNLQRDRVYDATSTMDGFAVYRVPFIGPARYPIAPSVSRFVEPFDLVHVHAIDFFVDFLSATRRFHRRPIVVNTHGGIFHTKWLLPAKKIYFHTLTRLYLRGVDAVICDSQHDYELFESIVPPHKLHIIRNGVTTRPFAGITKRVVHGMLLGIGRIVENKGIERIVELLPALARTYPAVHLVWVGADSEGRAASITARAAELGVAKRVQFTGQLAEPQLLQLLEKAHLYIAPAHYEAFGIATIEAMSSGTVPVVTPVGIHPEVVRDGHTGFVSGFEGATAEAMLAAALQLDDASLAEIGGRAQAIALQYDWSKVVETYVALYQRVLTGQAPQ